MDILWPALRPAAWAIGLGLAALTLLFHDELFAAINIWNTSTAYGHCWLVLPLTLWLLWERRHDAAAEPVAPQPWLAVLVVPFVLLWLAAYTLGVMEGRQLAAVFCAEVLLLSALGPRLWWALSAALLYLIFLVPFGAFITPALQGFTASFVAHGLNFLDVPNQVNAYRIDIPEGTFYVAQACAGLRFLIASIAFGVLYAVTMFRSPWRRAAFIATALVVPVLANGIRALGIVVLGHELGSAEAAATDHVVYGWVFFSVVIMLLALAGMPFRQDPAPAGPAAPPPPAGTPRRALQAAATVATLACFCPMLALMLLCLPLLDKGGAAPRAESVLVSPPGCAMTASRQAGAVLTQDFLCGKAHLSARLEILPHRANPSRVVEAAQIPASELIGGGDFDAGVISIDGATPATWLSDHSREAPRLAAAVLFIDGAPALGGLHDRLRLTKDLLTGSGGPATALVVAVTGGTNAPETVLQTFLQSQGNITQRVINR